jgi:putative tryptophan/tyrosine transport system substrate-binding protein
MIGRREFITLLGGGVAAWPVTARAQQPSMPVIGFLNGQTAAGFVHLVAAFRKGLNDVGFVEGKNVQIEYRWADGQLDRLPSLANDFVRQQVSVIVATGGGHRAARAATTTIPIVISVGGDPVGDGLVTSLNRPGANLTGMTVFSDTVVAKRLQLLHEVTPDTDQFGVLHDPTMSAAQAELRELETATEAIKKRIRVVNVMPESNLEAAFVTLAEMRVGAVVIGSGAQFNNRRAQIVALAAKHALPAIYDTRESVAIGGLMSYGASVPEVYQQIGVYAGRILKGAKPADLPFLQPTKFNLIINLATAKALGLSIPSTLLIRADEVIE